MSNPLVSAILALQSMDNVDPTTFSPAIRILENASKMDKQSMLEWIRWVGCPNEINNIIKALPDKEKL